MKCLVTGAAGFLGSHLVDALLREGFQVIGVDNLSAGRLENLREAMGSPGFKFVKADLRYPASWPTGLFAGCDAVFHFAANPEVRHSTREPMEHYEQNLTTTMNALEAARRAGVKLFVFASSSTVYGDPEMIPTPEDHPLRPISVYGATKAAGEVMCHAYARLYGFKCLVLRYANIIGPRLRHGVIYDFILKLRRSPGELEILGDGTQRKSYLHVSDAVEATIKAALKALEVDEQYLVLNVGNRDWTTVTEIADEVVKAMGLQGVEYRYKPGTPDGRGWPGDVKLMLLDITRITKLTGWEPRLTSRQAVALTAHQLVEELNAKP